MKDRSDRPDEAGLFASLPSTEGCSGLFGCLDPEPSAQFWRPVAGDGTGAHLSRVTRQGLGQDGQRHSGSRADGRLEHLGHGRHRTALAQSIAGPQNRGEPDEKAEAGRDQPMESRIDESQTDRNRTTPGQREHGELEPAGEGGMKHGAHEGDRRQSDDQGRCHGSEPASETRHRSRRRGVARRGPQRGREQQPESTCDQRRLRLPVQLECRCRAAQVTDDGIPKPRRDVPGRSRHEGRAGKSQRRVHERPRGEISHPQVSRVRGQRDDGQPPRRPVRPRALNPVRPR